MCWEIGAWAPPLSRLRVTSLRCARIWLASLRRWDERDELCCNVARTVRRCRSKTSKSQTQAKREGLVHRTKASEYGLRRRPAKEAMHVKQFLIGAIVLGA
jgi:hypothetical protein